MEVSTSQPARSNLGWHRFLPVILRQRLEGRVELQTIIRNGGWLFADRIFRMGAGLLVGIWLVRYLGPTQLGLWSYAGSFAGFFGSIALLGLDNIVIRELIKQPERQGEILGSALGLKLIASTAAVAVSIGAIGLVRPGETTVALLVGIAALGFIFQSTNVIDYYFQSTVQSKYTVLSASSAFLLTTIGKIVLLLNSGSLLGFALLGLAEIAITAVFLIIVYRRNARVRVRWHFEWNCARELLSHSWTQIIAVIAVVIYMRIDQIMIGHFLGDHEVGLFAASVRLSEMWYFIPLGIASSVLPALILARRQDNRIFLNRVQLLYDVMAWLAIFVAVFTTFTAHGIIAFLYGPAFRESAAVLSIQIWAGVFVCLGVIQLGWMTVQNLQRYSMYLTITGAVLNIAFNVILLPRYGVKGAAYATLVAQGVQIFMPFFIRELRPNFLMMMNSLLAPFRFINSLINHGKP